jgi:hypothetical protein
MEDEMNTSSESVSNPNNLRILIVSTGKTGNTWLKHLLANIYDLPVVAPGRMFDAAEVESLGWRWVAHQHYRARADLIGCGRRNNIVFVTTLRHPCDALVSKFHYVRNLGPRLKFADVDRSPTLALDGDTIGKHTAAYVLDGYSIALDISLGWLRSGQSLLIRYEDLRHDPVAALEQLTDSISKVPRFRIERAIEKCSIDQMRKMKGADPKFFRQGKVGGWRTELPEEIIDIFRHTDPYPAQFAELGYSLDQDYPIAPLPTRSPVRPTSEQVRPTFIDQVHATARVNPHWPIAWPDWPPGLRPKIEALLQKVVRRLLRWYINPIVEQQNRYNSALVQAVDEMWWGISYLERRLSEMEDRNDQNDE